MNLIPIHEVPSLPNEIIIGWDKIQEYDTKGVKYLDPLMLQLNSGNKRRKEHISSRRLFSELLKEVKVSSTDVELKKMELGKPYGISGAEHIHASFSHSEDWVVCALSLKLDVGIDCEPLNRKVNPRIFDRILDDSEKGILNELNPLAIWTMKEAVVKCIGTGIRTSLQKYPITKKENVYSVDMEDHSIKIVPFKWKNHQLSVAWRE